MRVADLLPEVREYLGAWECFRTMGFPAADLFFSLHDGQAWLVVKQDGREAKFSLGVSCTDLDAAQKQYRVACIEWNSPEGFTNEERAKVRDNSYARSRFVEIATSLVMNGFRLNAERKL